MLGIGGRPAVSGLWQPMRNMDEARRMWETSERLTGVRSHTAS